MMTNEQLTAIGKLIAALEKINPKVTPHIVAESIRNPRQLVPFWFVETFKKTLLVDKDYANEKLVAELYAQAEPIEYVTPAQSGLINVAYVKAKSEPAIADARKAFGAKIKAAREAAGMTQESLAAAAGIKQANLARIESGRYGVTLGTIARLGLALGVDLI